MARISSTIGLSIVILVVFCHSARAENGNDLLHGAAHIGASYAINTITFAALNRLAFDPGPSMVFAGAAAVGVSLLYKRLESASGPDTALPFETGVALAIRF
ncbi:MAG: hypothetical protein HYR96_00510 [Deltaproteobacteria bacterium]|nr:hypothetical protein [Deltaproteobacteria bacterium]MBI3294732.1 hypothetical protein [Deltaproteobacteria bacterium]